MESGEQPLENKRKMLGFQHYIAMKQLPDISLHKTVFNINYNAKYFNNISKAPLRTRIKECTNGLDIDYFQVLPYHPPFNHSWRLGRVVCKELGINKKNFNPEYIKFSKSTCNYFTEIQLIYIQMAQR